VQSCSRAVVQSPAQAPYQMEQQHQHRKLIKKQPGGPPTSYSTQDRSRTLRRTASLNPTYKSSSPSPFAGPVKGVHTQPQSQPSQAKLPGSQATISSPQPSDLTSNNPSPSSTSLDLHLQPAHSSVEPAYAQSNGQFSHPSAAPESRPNTYKRASVSDKTNEELIGAPFDAQAIFQNIQLQQASQPPPRPPPPTHAYTSDARLVSPKLRQSASFAALGKKMETITPPRSDGSGGTKSPRQRYSDESGDSQKNRKSDGGKKKSGFSSFMSGLVGSPRRPTISTPTNPMHVTHVSIDNETGAYTVRPCQFVPVELLSVLYLVPIFPPFLLTWRGDGKFSVLLTLSRVCPRNGNACWSEKASRRLNRRKTHRLWSTSSHFTKRTPRERGKIRFGTSLAIPIHKLPQLLQLPPLLQFKPSSIRPVSVQISEPIAVRKCLVHQPALDFRATTKTASRIPELLRQFLAVILPQLLHRSMAISFLTDPHQNHPVLLQLPT
jgi:hypothetical protein